jgi:hypothetical protein
MCYVTREGVVLGADSTTSFGGNRFHYYNHNQKLFEVGEESTLGIITWGLGGFAEVSYRTLIARFSDDLDLKPPKSVQEAAERWANFFSPIFFQSSFVMALLDLHQKPPHDPSGVTPNARDEDEEKLYDTLRSSLVVGFCLGGYVGPDREPKGFEINFDPLNPAPSVPSPGHPIIPPTPAPPIEIPLGKYRFYGAPNMIDRLINGYDGEIREQILTSGKWQGTDKQLDDILEEGFLDHPAPPLREAVDFVYTCIFSTIKALKFSFFSQICGGPIEIGVISTDRKFRWVRHKLWDAAIVEGDRATEKAYDF